MIEIRIKHFKSSTVLFKTLKVLFYIEKGIKKAH